VNGLLAVLLTLIAVAGTATVLTREAVKQVIVLGVMGLLLAILFYALQAPDVALSELIVGSAALPVMLTLAIAKLRAQHVARTQEDPEAQTQEEGED
jgi:energy-converting hydrogenase B subunit D